MGYRENGLQSKWNQSKRKQSRCRSAINTIELAQNKYLAILNQTVFGLAWCSRVQGIYLHLLHRIADILVPISVTSRQLNMTSCYNPGPISATRISHVVTIQSPISATIISHVVIFQGLISKTRISHIISSRHRGGLQLFCQGVAKYKSAREARKFFLPPPVKFFIKKGGKMSYIHTS